MYHECSSWIKQARSGKLDKMGRRNLNLVYMVCVYFFNPPHFLKTSPPPHRKVNKKKMNSYFSVFSPLSYLIDN